jgi:hypothetical protein
MLSTFNEVRGLAALVWVKLCEISAKTCGFFDLLRFATLKIRQDWLMREQTKRRSTPGGTTRLLWLSAQRPRTRS